MQTIFLSQSAAQSALSIRQQSPAQPGWSWGIRQIPGMRMWAVCQFWSAASV